MTFKASSIFTFCFCFVAASFLAVHHAHMKSPVQNREIASWTPVAKPWYDASYKL